MPSIKLRSRGIGARATLCCLESDHDSYEYVSCFLLRYVPVMRRRMARWTILYLATVVSIYARIASFIANVRPNKAGALSFRADRQ